MSAQWREVRVEARDCLALAAPLVVAQLATVAMGVTDTIFMGRLGVDAVAAGGLAIAAFSTVVVLAGGALTVVSPWVAQAQAQGRSDEVGAAVRAGLVVALIGAVVGTGVLAAVGALLGTLGQPPLTLAPARGLLLAIAPTLPAALGLHVLRHAFVGAGRPRVVLVVTAVGAVLNAALDYALGFGRLGAPRLGLVGLGVATSLATWTMLFVAAWLAMQAGLLRAGRVERAHVGRVLRRGTPVAVMFGLEAALFAMATFVVGRSGLAWLAAHQIVLQTTYAMYMVPQGISQAAAVRVARAVASNDTRGTRRAAWTAVALGAAFMSGAALAYLVAPGPLASIFIRRADLDADLLARVGVLFAIAAMYQLFDGAQVVASGALRGLHDTAIPMRATFIAYVLVGMPSVLVLGALFGAPGAWWGLVAGLGVAGALLVVRLRVRAGRAALARAGSEPP